MNRIRCHKTRTQNIKPIEPQPEDQKILPTCEIDLHNRFVAGSCKELDNQLKSAIRDSRKLRRWEEEGKIKAECACDSPSFMFVYVLDESILPEIRKVSLVSGKR